MTAPSSAPSVPLVWSIRPVRLGLRAAPAARLRCELLFPPSVPGGALLGEWCWLDTGAPFSVVPFNVHRQGLAWQPLPGVRSHWMGQPCQVGEMQVWFPTAPGSAGRGPFPLLAKFPVSDPPGPPIPVLLGLEWLLTNHASITLGPAPQDGVIRMP